MSTLSAQQATSILTRLGWPVAKIGLPAAVKLFQAAYLGPDPAHHVLLAVDGVVGPATSAALVTSSETEMASPHFAWSELQCRCEGRYQGCRGIWVDRRLLVALETLRARCYPQGLTPRSVCRCPQRNAEVGGAKDSQHLYGRAADVPATVPTAVVRQLGLFSGIGYSPRLGKVVHVDVRPAPVSPFADGE